MSFDADFWDHALRIAEVIAVLIFSVAMIFLKANFVSKKDFEASTGALGTRSSALENRMGIVESDIKHLPTTKEFTDLQLSIANVAGEQKALRAAIEPVASSVRRIEEWLLNRDDKS